MSETNSPNSPDWVVLKFGGTSVATPERWREIAAVLRSRIAEGATPFVVCSAIGGISNALEDLLASLAAALPHDDALESIEERHRSLAQGLGVDAEQAIGNYIESLRRICLGASLVGEVSPRLRARMMSSGELMLTRLAAAHLANVGFRPHWLDAREVLHAEAAGSGDAFRSYLSSRCDFTPRPALSAQLHETGADVVLTQGFIATNERGETVLLGRGGSDTSAAYFSTIIGASRCEIWTDVPGMYTANPREVPSARLLKHLDYDEAQELATLGAKVLHPRSIEPARRYRVPIHIKCTQLPEVHGTIISSDAPDFGPQVKAISAKGGMLLVSMNTLGMWQQVGFLADIFACFKARELSVDLVATSEMNVTVSLDPASNDLDDDTISALIADLSAYCEASTISGCAAVGLVGHDIRAILHKLAPALKVFEEQQIYLLSQAASDLNLTFVVDGDQAGRLVQKLHAMLFGSRVEDELFGATWSELFGGTPLMELPGGPNVWWRGRKDELVSMAAEESPAFVYDRATLKARAAEIVGISSVSRAYYAIKANPHPEVLRLFEAARLGFECVSSAELAHVFEVCPDIAPDRVLFTPNFAAREEYEDAYRRGVHVTLDNAYVLRNWGDMFSGRRALLRVDPGSGKGHHKHVQTAGDHSKFGVSTDELAEVAQLADDLGLVLFGLHSHLGSGIRDPATWPQTAAFLDTLRRHFPDAKVLNLGGGLGVPERPGERPLDVERLDEVLGAFKDTRGGLDLWLEPGRYLVSEAGVLLSTVTQTKQKGAHRYVGVDVGMNSLIRPALYGAYHHIVNLSRLDDPPSSLADVVGPICESGDVLGHNRPLPHTREGDVLLIATAGAYGRAMASSYNLRAPAVERLI